MHSILITGSSLNKRLETASQHAKTTLDQGLDIKVLKPDPSITIKQVREIEVFLSKKPYQNDKNICLITHADKLTIPAQNAILKILEEPPKNSLVILLTKNQHQLLETITSRCQIIRLLNQTKLSKADHQIQKDIFESITKLSIPERINLVSTHATNKKDAIDFCTSQLLFLKPSISTHHQIIKKLTLSIMHLNANLNPKLVLESLFFSY
jgi:DNA polymerase III delta prime subunit